MKKGPYIKTESMCELKVKPVNFDSMDTKFPKNIIKFKTKDSKKWKVYVCITIPDFSILQCINSNLIN